MPTLDNKIQEIINKAKKEKRYFEFSEEENQKIYEEISVKIDEARNEYLKWESESLIEAANAVINS